ncbi:MAG: hypothetical protein R3B09_30065 [Nannocystaceae bacterium]
MTVNALGKAILFMDAAGSFIQTGATMTMQIPFTLTSYGPSRGASRGAAASSSRT